MPTPPPEPVEEKVSEQEHLRRMGAVAFIEAVLSGLADYSYSTRSYMPCGEDYTNFTQMLERVRAFVKARPDWAGQIVERAFRQFGPEESVQIELDRLRKLIAEFEKKAGVKITDHGYLNRRMADAVGVVMKLGGPDAYMKKMRENLDDAHRKAQNIERELREILGKHGE